MESSVARPRLRTFVRAGVPTLLIALLASGCLLPPEPATDAGRDVFNLYVVVLALAAVVFIGVEGFIVYAIVRYRRQPDDEVLPEQHHGNNLVEIIWTAIPTVIVLVLFVLSTITLGRVEARADQPGATIRVEGFQWSWRFHYENGVVVNPQGGQPPDLPIPVGEPVRLVLDSIDVNHAFYVPQFLIKRDLIPVTEEGDQNELEFTVNEEGTYAGQCAEFCGVDHYNMRFTVTAMPRAEYDATIEALASGSPPPAPSGAAGDCETTVAITARDTQFDIDSFEAPADTPFCIEFENQDENIPHNVSIYDGGEALFTGEFLNTTGNITYQVPALPEGEFRFICDAHPTTMVGDVVVSP
jgi:cytochrome c oxidase subunit II